VRKKHIEKYNLKKTKGYLPEANIPQTLKVIKKIKRK